MNDDARETARHDAASTALVSVIMIFLNGERFMAEAIESVLAQTYPHWELILVDDGSTDGSADIASRYVAQRPSQIIYTHHDERANLGMSASRNRGIELARGQAIAFLDADDVYRPDKLSIQTAILAQHPDAAMVYGPTEHWHSWSGRLEDRTRDRLRRLGVPPDTLVQPPDLVTMWLRGAGQTPGTCGVLVRREALLAVGGFNAEFRGMYEDQVAFTKLALRYPIFVMGASLDRYRQQPESLTRRMLAAGHWNGNAPSPAQERFLLWLNAYLERERIEDDAVTSTLRAALLPYRSPVPLRALLRVADPTARRKAVMSARERTLRGWELSRATVASRFTRGDAGTGLERGDDARSAHQYRERIDPVPAGVKRPLWSVMIPTYDCADYLRETLTSVLDQDPGPDVMQIEVIDDHSTRDDPEAVVAEVGRGRVGFFRQSVNVGHVANFNTCLQRSRGHLVHLLHGDDAVRPGFYAVMQRPFQAHPEMGAAFCRVVYIDENSTEMSVGRMARPESGTIPNWLEQIAGGQQLQAPTMVVRRDVYERLGGFDSRVRAYGEDWEMWVRIAAHCSVWYQNEPLAAYRLRSSSLSGATVRSGENMRDLARVVEINRAVLPAGREQKLTARAREENALGALRRAGSMLARGDSAGSLAQLREALRTSRTTRVLKDGGELFGLWLFRSTRARLRPRR